MINLTKEEIMIFFNTRKEAREWAKNKRVVDLGMGNTKRWAVKILD